MKILSPSILAADLLNLGKEIKKIEDAGAQYVHIDIMDGVFVPNISFGMPIITAVNSCTHLVLDVHLMITNPRKYVDTFIECGADIITFHKEVLNHEEIVEMCSYIHSKNVRVGISIKPNTPWEELVPYLDMVDMVLIMTVEPGFGGQRFMENTMEKVSAIRNLKPSLDIEVDGGINNDTIKVADKCGANVFVLGTAFFKSEKIVTIQELLDEK